MMNIQSLTLMAMVVLVFGNPLSQNVLLRKIIAEVQNLISKNLNHTVPDPKGNGGSTCVTDFFCLAEKVLNHSLTENPSHEEVKNLKDVLHQYNKFQGRENCTLKTNGTYQLSNFLTEVMNCTIKCLDDLNACKNH